MRARLPRVAALSLACALTTLSPSHPLTLSPRQEGPPQKAGDVSWLEEEVGDGVVWKRYAFRNLGGGKQSIHLLDVDLSKKGVRLEIADAGAGVEKLSTFAGATDAIAAFNGGYFDARGNPVGLFKVGGKALAFNPTTQPARAAIGVAKDGGVLMKRVPSDDGWDEVDQALGAGPMLVMDGKEVVDFGVEGFEREAFLGPNPRTAVGLTAKGRLLVAVVDGRGDAAKGMSMADLAGLMKALGCATAMNLDGGGSSAMWVRGKAGGIVNRPCDRGGERPVSNGVLIFAPDVTVFDNDSPQFTANPKARWERINTMAGATGTDLKVQGESYSLCRQGIGAEAVWRLEVDWNGEYEVFARWPAGRFTANATFRVVTGVMDKSVKVDLSKGGGTWTSLGTCTLMKSGQIQAVELKTSDDKPLAADAVKIVQKR